MTLKELKQVVKFCRDNGIIEYKCDGLELKFTPPAKSSQIESKLVKSEPIGKIPDTTSSQPLPEVPWAKYNEEELATWSSQAEPESDM